MREELKAERAQRPPGAERWWGQPQAPVHPWTRSGPPPTPLQHLLAAASQWEWVGRADRGHPDRGPSPPRIRI